MSERGHFIAIEGGDGSGKGTQTIKLVDDLEQQGLNVLQTTFPRYGKVSAENVERYLNNNFGDALTIPPQLASQPYAIDRAAAAPEIRAHLSRGGVVVTDRYVASNLAHQGAKIDDDAERHRFYEQQKAIEYGILGLPHPDINIVLLVPPKVAQHNVALKATRSYTTASHDGHEASSDHLEKAKNNYAELCELYPTEFMAVECMRNAQAMRSIEEIHMDIKEIVYKILGLK
jgi:dTMP kinase